MLIKSVTKPTAHLRSLLLECPDVTLEQSQAPAPETVATTEAVRRPDASTATSPTTAPGPTSCFGTPSIDTSADPDSMTKRQWPKSPSLVNG